MYCSRFLLLFLNPHTSLLREHILPASVWLFWLPVNHCQYLKLGSSARQCRSQSYICSSFMLHWPPFSSSSFSPASTSYLILAQENEVRDERLHTWGWSARVVHGNGKVQTVAVGGCGFLPFFAVDAFFRKSWTRLNLKKCYGYG